MTYATRIYVFDPKWRRVPTRQDDDAVHAALGDKWWTASEIATRLGRRKVLVVQALVRLRAAANEIEALRKERDEARQKIRRFHRRVQALEGPFQSKLAEASAGRDYWRNMALAGEEGFKNLRRGITAIQWCAKTGPDNPIVNRIRRFADIALAGGLVKW